MIDHHRVLAIIPARGGSKGLPRKNIRMLHGKPLLGWPVAAARESAVVDRVVVSTDDAEIAHIAKEEGADVPFLRPPELASDTATSADAIIHALDTLAHVGDTYDYFVLLEPTSPLTVAADVTQAMTTLHRQRATADAILGVAKVESCHPDFLTRVGPSGTLQPADGSSFATPKRRQDISALYYFEGSLYASDVAVFRHLRTFVHNRTLPYIVPRWMAVEVDEELDLLLVETIMRHRAQLSRD